TSIRNRKRSGSQNSQANIASGNNHCDEPMTELDCDQEEPTAQILMERVMWDIESIRCELEDLFQQEKRLWTPSAFVESCIVGGFVEKVNKTGIAKIKAWLNNRKTKELKLERLNASSVVVEESEIVQ